MIKTYKINKGKFLILKLNILHIMKDKLRILQIENYKKLNPEMW